MGKRNDDTSSPDEGEQYIVEGIVGKKICKGIAYYQIKWLGYPEDQNTWEPLKNCIGAYSLIREFEANYEQNKQSKPYRRKSKKAANGNKPATSGRKTDVCETSKRLEGLIINLDDITGSKIVPEQHAVGSDWNEESAGMNDDNNYDEYSSGKVIASEKTTSRSSERTICDEKDQDNETVPELDTHRNDLDTTSSSQMNTVMSNDSIVPTAASNLEDEIKLKLSKYCANDVEIVGLEPVKNAVTIGIRIKQDKDVIGRFSSQEVTRLWPQLYVSFLESHIVFEDKCST